jgi:hypothetical protein
MLCRFVFGRLVSDLSFRRSQLWRSLGGLALYNNRSHTRTGMKEQLRLEAAMLWALAGTVTALFAVFPSI